MNHWLLLAYFFFVWEATIGYCLHSSLVLSTTLLAPNIELFLCGSLCTSVIALDFSFDNIVDQVVLLSHYAFG